MIGRVGISGRGAALAGGGFLAVVALVLSITVAVSAVPPVPAEGPAILAGAPALAGTKLPDPQTRARNAWASALVSSGRWRVSASNAAGQAAICRAVVAPWLGAAGAVPSDRPTLAATPRALPSRTYASQAPPLFAA